MHTIKHEIFLPNINIYGKAAKTVKQTITLTNTYMYVHMYMSTCALMLAGVHVNNNYS